ncbi:hypothetical protein H106_00001, partial [Trichophyton rubrum CBS 735.88]
NALPKVDYALKDIVISSKELVVELRTSDSRLLKLRLKLKIEFKEDNNKEDMAPVISRRRDKNSLELIVIISRYKPSITKSYFNSKSVLLYGMVARVYIAK